MFKFIKSKQMVLFVSSLVMCSGLLLSSVSLSEDINFPGQICKPANLAQALARGMSWNQFRVYNDSDTQEFFVTCGLSKNATEMTDVDRGYFISHFDEGYDGVSSVDCIWRQYAENVISSDIATTVVALTHGISTASATPTTAFDGSGVDIGGNFTQLTSQNDFLSITCLLPAKTGIQGIYLFD